MDHDRIREEGRMTDTTWALEFRRGDAEHWVRLDGVDADAALARLLAELRGPHDWVEVRRVRRARPGGLEPA